MAIHRQYPDKITGYELNPRNGYFSIIIPEESINLCDNPSLELDDTNWEGYPIGTPPAHGRTADEQRRGAWSFYGTPDPLSMQPYQGVAYNAFRVYNTNLYYYSFDFLGAFGVEYITWASASVLPQISGAYGPVKSFIGNGHWQRIVNWFYAHSSAITALMVAEPRKPTEFTGKIFYVDGMQIEDNSYATTYFDGETDGLVVGVDHFLWNGIPHASTSWRSGDTRSGGKIVYLKDIGFDVLAYSGLGKQTDRHILTPLALIDGAYYQRSITEMRDYVLTGAISKKSYQEMKAAVAELSQYFSYKESTIGQPTTIRMQDVDNCGEIIGDPLFIRSLYMGGLEETIDNLYQERFAISLQMPQPYMLVDGENGDEFDRTWDTETMYVMSMRDIDIDDTHLWQNMDDGVNNWVNTICEAADGNIYIGGEFTQILPGTACSYIAYWDKDDLDWNVLSVATNGMNAPVNKIIKGPNNTLYICGEFDDVQGGGGGTYEKVVQYDPATTNFTALGAGLPGAVANAQCFDIAIDPTTGYLWAVHTIDSGGSLRGQVSYWDGSSWTTSKTTGSTGIYWYTISISRDGRIFVGGETGGAGYLLYSDDGTSYYDVPNGDLDAPVYDTTIAEDGTLYACGLFRDEVPGVSGLNGVLGSTGSGVFKLGDGIETDAGGDNDPCNISHYNGILYVTGGIKWAYNGAGNFTQTWYFFDITGGITHEDSVALWNGSSWLRPDFRINDAVGAIANKCTPTAKIIFDRHGNEYIAMAGDPIRYEQDFAYSYVIDIDNIGSDNTFPKFEVTSESTGTLVWLRNETTNETVYFNQELSDGEIVTIDFVNKTFVSNINDSIINSILPGSDFATFHLKPGDNRITIFVMDAGGDPEDTYGRTWWPIRHDYSGGALY